MEIGRGGGGEEILSLAEEGQRKGAREGRKIWSIPYVYVPTNTYTECLGWAGPFLIGSVAKRENMASLALSLSSSRQLGSASLFCSFIQAVFPSIRPMLLQAHNIYFRNLAP